MIKEVDTDGNSTVEWAEFCTMMDSIKNGKGASAMATVVKKKQEMIKLEGSGGSTHAFSVDEKNAFTHHLNSCLADDEDVKARLPMDIESMALFEQCGDGLMLCKVRAELYSEA